MSQTSKVIADFNSLISAYRGELEVSVTSAEALDSKTMSRLEKALKSSKEAEGKTLKIVNKVNPAVLGGLLVDFGDKTSKLAALWRAVLTCLVDLSASSKVTRFNAALQRKCLVQEFETTDIFKNPFKTWIPAV